VGRLDSALLRPVFAAAAVLAGTTWATPASAAEPTVCRTGGVEMILGGSAASPCQTPARAPSTRPSPAHGTLQVSTRLQAARDDERRRILASELQQELAGLARLQAAAPDDAPARLRVKDNIAALQRELAGTPGQAPGR
jgi:hypothetical protein